MAIRKLFGRVVETLFGTRRRMLITFLGGAAAIACLLAIGLICYVKSGGMTARQDPSAVERYIASMLVDASIPGEAQRTVNPLAKEPLAAILASGRQLYSKNCETCHGFDGLGRTAAGLGLYPPPANLAASKTRNRTDGAVFYLIRNGIRNTGMPAWSLTDDQTWQLVSYIRHLPPVVNPTAGAPIASKVSSATYIGSAACRKCHEEIYDRWKSTLMANVVRNPREHPEAIIPDLAKPEPLVKFTVADIDFVYGSKWKQRYFKKIGDDYFPLPAQWDVTHQKWRPYFVKDDWWVPHYPADNFKRPTSATCDGCHSVNYNIETKTVSEWNVGCEPLPRPGQRTCQKSHCRSDRQSRQSRLRASHRHLPSMSFPGSTARESNQGKILRLARGL